MKTIFLPLKNPFYLQEPTPDPVIAHRIEAVGSGSARGSLATKKVFFFFLPACALGTSRRTEPESSARRPVPSGELLAGHRDFGSGRAALEVVVAPQGAPRGGGSPSRPLKRLRGRSGGQCVVCVVCGLHRLGAWLLPFRSRSRRCACLASSRPRASPKCCCNVCSSPNKPMLA